MYHSRVVYKEHIGLGLRGSTGYYLRSLGLLNPKNSGCKFLVIGTYKFCVCMEGKEGGNQRENERERI